MLLASAGYLFAASGLQSKPGYAELTMPGWFSANTQVALNLGPGGVKPVRWMANRIFDESDEEMDLSKRVILSVLQDLEGVQLRVYEVENNRPVFDQAIDETMVSLKQEDWQILLRVREDKERIVVMQSEDDGLIYGLLSEYGMYVVLLLCCLM